MAAATTRKYAEDTKVSADETEREIRRLLVKHGATAFVSGFDGDRQAIQFELSGRRIRFDLTMPQANEFARTPGGITRPIERRAAAREQAIRQRWRALYLIIRAKLEAIESGVRTAEDEFGMDTLVPTASGIQRVGDWVRPQIARAYELGEMPSMLALPAARENQP